MKFSREIEYHTIPEWATSYIDYRYLKKLLKYALRKVPDSSGLNSPLLSPMMSLKDFQFSVTDEANKVNRFFIAKLQQFRSEFESVLFYLNSLHKETSLNSFEVKSLISFRELDDTENRATSMQRTFHELHLHLTWLELYCEINYIALKKLLEKAFDENLQLYIDSLEFTSWNKDILNVKEQMYAVLADECLNGNIKDAMNLLACYKRFKTSDIAVISFCLAVLFVMGCISSFILYNEGIQNLYSSMCFFRICFSISFIVLGFSWIVYYLDKNGVGWFYLFDISPTIKISYIQITRFSLILFACCSIMLALNLATIYYFPSGFGNIVPGALILLFSLFLLIPVKCHKQGRFFLLKTLVNALISPIGNIRFSNYIAVSWLTSLVIIFKDFYLCIHFYTSSNWVNIQEPPDERILYFVSLAPFFLRFLQDVKRVISNRSIMSRFIKNTLRTMSCLTLITTAYLGLSTSTLWIVLFIVSGVLFFGFDFWFDWDLRLDFYNGANNDRKFSNQFYMFAVTVNLLLSYINISSILPINVLHNEYIDDEALLLCLLLLEICRKVVWTVVRIEREKHDNKEKFRKFDYLKTKV